jgi:hypothetical protein
MPEEFVDRHHRRLGWLGSRESNVRLAGLRRDGDGAWGGVASRLYAAVVTTDLVRV